MYTALAEETSNNGLLLYNVSLTRFPILLPFVCSFLKFSTTPGDPRYGFTGRDISNFVPGLTERLALELLVGI